MERASVERETGGHRGGRRLLPLDGRGRTLAALMTLRKDLIILRSASTTVGLSTAGDGFLIEFGSADAVTLGGAQEELIVRTADVPEPRRVRLRIGISATIVEGDDRRRGATRRTGRARRCLHLAHRP